MEGGERGRAGEGEGEVDKTRLVTKGVQRGQKTLFTARKQSCGKVKFLKGMGWILIPYQGGYVWGWVPTPPPLPIHGTWDTAGYGRQTGGTHPTGMLSCFFYL